MKLPGDSEILPRACGRSLPRGDVPGAMMFTVGRNRVQHVPAPRQERFVLGGRRRALVRPELRRPELPLVRLDPDLDVVDLREPRDQIGEVGAVRVARCRRLGRVAAIRGVDRHDDPVADGRLLQLDCVVPYHLGRARAPQQRDPIHADAELAGERNSRIGFPAKQVPGRTDEHLWIGAGGRNEGETGGDGCECDQQAPAHRATPSGWSDQLFAARLAQGAVTVELLDQSQARADAGPVLVLRPVTKPAA
jgi:hypothetical protein